MAGLSIKERKEWIKSRTRNPFLWTGTEGSMNQRPQDLCRGPPTAQQPLGSINTGYWLTCALRRKLAGLEFDCREPPFWGPLESELTDSHYYFLQGLVSWSASCFYLASLSSVLPYNFIASALMTAQAALSEEPTSLLLFGLSSVL